MIIAGTLISGCSEINLGIALSAARASAGEFLHLRTMPTGMGSQFCTDAIQE